MLTNTLEQSVLNAYFDRLRNSRNLHERRSLLVGRDFWKGHPVLLDTELLLEHMHIVGSTGAGKSTLGLATDLIQLIRRRDGAVVIIDGKGDDALFNTARIEAERAGTQFKWFTNKPFRSTYLFNPFDERTTSRLTVPEIVGLVIQSLNLHHGDEYGRAWFSVASRILLKRAVQFEQDSQPGRPSWMDGPREYSMFPRTTLRSLRHLDSIIQRMANNSDDYQAAKQLAFVVECLADFEQLNFGLDRETPNSVLENAIFMPEVIAQKQVVYFYLVGASDLTSVGEIGRLALFALLNGAMVHREQTGETARVYCVCDEAQTLIAKNIANVLAQARSHGLACILAHQSMSQLNPPGGVDLRELVMTCTTTKQIFSARDPWLQKYISDMSGATKYASLSYEVDAQDVMSGDIRAERAGPGWVNPVPVSVREYMGPRLTLSEIQQFSRMPNVCMFSVEHSRSFSQLMGFFPMLVDYPIPEHEYKRRRDQVPWPNGTAATLEIRPSWPAPRVGTLIPKSHPEIKQPADATQQKLRDLKRRLLEE